MDRQGALLNILGFQHQSVSLDIVIAAVPAGKAVSRACRVCRRSRVVTSVNGLRIQYGIVPVHKGNRIKRSLGKHRRYVLRPAHRQRFGFVRTANIAGPIAEFPTKSFIGLQLNFGVFIELVRAHYVCGHEYAQHLFPSAYSALTRHINGQVMLIPKSVCRHQAFGTGSCGNQTCLRRFESSLRRRYLGLIFLVRGRRTCVRIRRFRIRIRRSRVWIRRFRIRVRRSRVRIRCFRIRIRRSRVRIRCFRIRIRRFRVRSRRLNGRFRRTCSRLFSKCCRRYQCQYQQRRQYYRHHSGFHLFTLRLSNV